MLEIQDHGAVREIRLDRPPANALNGELVDALTAALQTAGKEVDAVVISGAGRMFSAGLDVPELLQLDRSRFAVLWDAFTGLMQIIATLPVPVVFAMQGHALAGGALLALFGDYRIMPRGPFKTGLNEVQVGLIAPTPVHQALVRLVGPNRAAQMLVSGEMMDAEKALAIGLVDELAETPADVLPAALAWCELHLALPRHALALSRAMVRADLDAIFEKYSASENDAWVELWFSEATQATLQKLVASLGK
jgi:enoyl-CoA hydratase/carnithine racemase